MPKNEDKTVPPTTQGSAASRLEARIQTLHGLDSNPSIQDVPGEIVVTGEPSRVSGAETEPAIKISAPGTTARDFQSRRAEAEPLFEELDKRYWKEHTYTNQYSPETEQRRDEISQLQDRYSRIFNLE
jgi:hypothetical protein